MDFPGEKVAIRLLELLEKSGSGLLAPWQIKRVGRARAEARAHERQYLARVEEDISRMQADRDRLDLLGATAKTEGAQLLPSKGVVAPGAGGEDRRELALAPFVDAVRADVAIQGLRRAINLKRVLLFAEEAAEEIDRRATASGRAGEPATEVDADWLTKWRAAAETVSREEMQRLWARLLAGEVAQPGAHSLRSIEMLACMSAADAELFARAAPFMVWADDDWDVPGGIVRLAPEILSRQGLSVQDILDLEDMGALVWAPGLALSPVSVGPDSGRNVFILQLRDVALLFFMRKMEKAEIQLTRLQFPISRLTGAGAEILSLASGPFPPGEDYLREIAKEGMRQGAVFVKRGVAEWDGEKATVSGLTLLAGCDAGS